MNLKGLKFGKLTVLERDMSKNTSAIYWICKCDCGNIKSIRGSNLTSKTKPTKSCGCLNKGKNIDIDSIIGKKFGKLTVLKRDMSKEIGHGKASYWICKCDCGNITSVIKSELISKKIQSCGCLKKEVISNKNILDLTNKRYNYVTAIKNTNKQNDRKCFLWLCQCDCGNTFITSSEYLQSGHINSCGCKNIKSIGEEKICQILIDNNINFTKEFTFNDCRNPKTNRLYRYDFAILKNNNPILLIEFDGEQHFLKENKWHFDVESIKFNDNFKNEYAKKNNISLIRIPYWEIDNLKFEDIFSNKYLIN